MKRATACWIMETLITYGPAIVGNRKFIGRLHPQHLLKSTLGFSRIFQLLILKGRYARGLRSTGSTTPSRRHRNSSTAVRGISLASSISCSSITVSQNRSQPQSCSSSSESENFEPQSQHHTWKLLHQSHLPVAMMESGELRMLSRTMAGRAFLPTHTGTI